MHRVSVWASQQTTAKFATGSVYNDDLRTCLELCRLSETLPDASIREITSGIILLRDFLFMHSGVTTGGKQAMDAVVSGRPSKAGAAC